MAKQDLSVTSAESLSALVDGEVSELELRRLLKQMEEDDRVAETWSRYQLISASVKGERPLMASASFANAISAAIADEPRHHAAAPNRFQKLIAGVGRVAIAASVAGALVVGVQQYSTDNSLEPVMANSTPVKSLQSDLPSGINVPALSARTVAIQSGYDSRPQESRRVMFVPHEQAAPIYNEDVSVYVNGLIEEHSGNAAATTHQGMLPFTRIILIDEE